LVVTAGAGRTVAATTGGGGPGGTVRGRVVGGSSDGSTGVGVDGLVASGVGVERPGSAVATSYCSADAAMLPLVAASCRWAPTATPIATASRARKA